jgi:chemotaxis protein methyltransferase CheR
MMVTDQDYQLFVFALKNSSRYDFSQYSEKSLKRRILKVLTEHSMTITTLITRIKNDPEFVETIVKEITVNTTELFRDPQVWQTIRFNVLPRFKNNSVINIWHAGCSTGQEVYSMLILLNELDLLDKSKVYATDINTDVMEVAKQVITGIALTFRTSTILMGGEENPYNYEEYNDVPYRKYFFLDKADDTIRMLPFLKENRF